MSNLEKSVLPTVLVTGASQGIGRSIAIHLSLSRKYKLALLSRNIDKLNETIELCKSVNNNIKILPLQCDITDTNKLKECIVKVGQDFGPFCVLINNAGIANPHLVNEKMDFTENIEKIVNTNMNSLIYSCAMSMPYLKETKLKYPYMNVAIIQISSRASTFRATDPGGSVYSASKFGVRGFSDVLFKEVKNLGIKVCHLMPGWVNTPIVLQYGDAVILENMIQASDVSYTVDFVLNCPETCCPLEILLYPQKDVLRSKAKL